MSTLEKRLQEVYRFFENKDTVLGYRKLMDCALDTQNLEIYNQIIEVTDWKSKHPDNESEFITKCLKVLEDISKIPIEVYTLCKVPLWYDKASDINALLSCAQDMNWAVESNTNNLKLN